MNHAQDFRRNPDLRARTPHLLDALEPRQLLSAAIVRGVLDVQGTRRDDSITLTRDGRRAVRVDVNGVAQSFSFRDFSRIRITAGAGDDFLVIGNAQVISSRATLFGGDGNDNIVTSAGDDSVDAGDGDDNVGTFAGDDTVHAGAGNDTVYGWDGDDSLSGDNGNDLLEGQDGDDTIVGGRGDDRLYDGGDRDRVYGNAGADHFFRSLVGDTSEFRDRAPDEPLDYDVIISNPGGDASLDGVTHGDFNYDGTVNFEDLLILAKNYGGAGPAFEEDVLFLAKNYGSAGTAAAAHA